MAAILDFRMKETFYDKDNAWIGFLGSKLVYLHVSNIILLQIVFELLQFPFSVVSVAAILDSDLVYHFSDVYLGSNWSLMSKLSKPSGICRSFWNGYGVIWQILYYMYKIPYFCRHFEFLQFSDPRHDRTSKWMLFFDSTPNLAIKNTRFEKNVVICPTLL